MKKLHKVIAIIGCISLLFIFTFAICSADTAYIGDPYGDIMLVPEYIIFSGVTTGEGSGTIAISNSQYNTGEGNDTVISILATTIGEGNNEGWFNIAIDNSSSSITFETDFNWNSVTLIYPDFYAIPNVPISQSTLVYEFPVNDQDIVDIGIDYMSNYYLGDGSLMEVNITDNFSTVPGGTDTEVEVRDIAASEISRYGFISDLYVDISFPGSQRQFTILKYPEANYGFVIGTRVFENLNVTEQVINPNILEWVSTSLSSFLDTDIFPDISIGELLFVIVAIPLAITFLKFFAGG